MRCAGLSSLLALGAAAVFGLAGANGVAAAAIGLVPLLLIAGVLGEGIASNRKLLEEQRYLARRAAFARASGNAMDMPDMVADQEALAGRAATG